MIRAVRAVNKLHRQQQRWECPKWQRPFLSEEGRGSVNIAKSA